MIKKKFKKIITALIFSFLVFFFSPNSLWSAEITVTTLPVNPVTEVTTNYAKLKGTVSPANTPGIAGYFAFAKSSIPLTRCSDVLEAHLTTPAQMLNGNATFEAWTLNSFNNNILEDNATYYYCAIVHKYTGVDIYGAVEHFIAKNSSTPDVNITTGEATNISTSQATVGATMTVDPATETWSDLFIAYRETNSETDNVCTPTSNSPTEQANSDGDSVYNFKKVYRFVLNGQPANTALVNGLKSNHRYVYCAYGNYFVNSTGISYYPTGEAKSFATKATASAEILPVVTTNQITNPTVYGNVTITGSVALKGRLTNAYFRYTDVPVGAGGQSFNCLNWAFFSETNRQILGSDYSTKQIEATFLPKVSKRYHYCAIAEFTYNGDITRQPGEVKAFAMLQSSGAFSVTTDNSYDQLSREGESDRMTTYLQGQVVSPTLMGTSEIQIRQDDIYFNLASAGTPHGSCSEMPRYLGTQVLSNSQLAPHPNGGNQVYISPSFYFNQKVNLEFGKGYYYCAMAKYHYYNSSGWHTGYKSGKVKYLVAIPGWTPETSGIFNVFTGSVTDINDHSAVFYGSANPYQIGGGYTEDHYYMAGYFRYSPSKVPPLFCNDIYGSEMKTTPEWHLWPVNEIVSWYTKVVNLEPNTKYYYCAVASNKKEGGIAYGGVQSFTTEPYVYSIKSSYNIETMPASIINGSSTVYLNGIYNATISNNTWFEYRTVEKRIRTILGAEIPDSIIYGPWEKVGLKNHTGQSTGNISYSLTGLSSDVIYEFRTAIQPANNQSSDFIIYGKSKTFDVPLVNIPRTEPILNPLPLDYCLTARSNDPLCPPVIVTPDPDYCKTTIGMYDPSCIEIYCATARNNDPLCTGYYCSTPAGQNDPSCIEIYCATASNDDPLCACTFQYSNWSDCLSEIQTRTVILSSPPSCFGNSITSRVCNSDNLGCNYTYSDWDVCANNTQTRTVLSTSPTGCVDVPNLTRTCYSGENNQNNKSWFEKLRSNVSDLLGIRKKNNENNGLGNDGQNLNPLVLGQNAEMPLLAIVGPKEGVETVFYRQIKENTRLQEIYGYKTGNDLDAFAWSLAHYFGRTFGYVNSAGKEIRVSPPNRAAYQLVLDGYKLFVYEYLDSKIISVQTISSALKNKLNYEYYFKKR